MDDHSHQVSQVECTDELKEDSIHSVKPERDSHENVFWNSFEGSSVTDLFEPHPGNTFDDDSWHYQMNLREENLQQRIDTVLSPSFIVPFNVDGMVIPLSKPLVRNDGVILVGSELNGHFSQCLNRLFIANYRSHLPSESISSIQLTGEITDMHWVGFYAVVVASGKEIQLVTVRNSTSGGPTTFSCQKQGLPIEVHSDTIRELAVSMTRHYLLSGGFDETVCVTDLQSLGHPGSCSITSKFDAHDVVSSLRWSPTETNLSWTTDGGDLQIADVRTRTAQLQIPLSDLTHTNLFGGLFSHEYLSPYEIILGFELGDMMFLDTRMPRGLTCTKHSRSPLRSIGDIRRSSLNKLAFFGLGGHVVCEWNPSSMLLENSISRLRECDASETRRNYKTNGDFAISNSNILAISDNAGIVTIFEN